MAEWPMTLFRPIKNGPYWGWTRQRGVDLGEGWETEEVIPADLGRELYEALNNFFGWDTKPSDLDTGDYDRIYALLSRYEREVGE